MILVDLPARMTCEQDGCARSCSVQLALLGTGTFAFIPAEKDWQVMLPPKDPGSAFRTRCREHSTRLQVGPAGPRIVPAEGH